MQSLDVHQRPPLCVPVVTRLVTQLPRSHGSTKDVHLAWACEYGVVDLTHQEVRTRVWSSTVSVDHQERT